MKEVVSDAGLVAFCGLYCGACRAYLNDRCRGCKENSKATWCKIRICCMENGYRSCADCKDFKDVNDCRKFNNFISKIFAFVFRSNRKACIEQIREKGNGKHAEIMASIKAHSLKR
ncbi:MAG: DUF3795 domain-containing protein [Deltaproteobacteria bacterium]|nr:DUF3795 domain-containing protein [Deltaproteobacteria bacterium]